MNYDDFQRTLARRIKELRIENNLTQEAISGLAMGVRVYQRIESGKGSPSLKSLFLIARTLNIHPAKLFEFPVDYEED